METQVSSPALGKWCHPNTVLDGDLDGDTGQRPGETPPCPPLAVVCGLMKAEPPGKGQGGSGGDPCRAQHSPRKWLTQRLRSALGMLQMVAQRLRRDSGRSACSLEPVSWLSYLTPLSRMFATCNGPQAPASVGQPQAQGADRAQAPGVEETQGQQLLRENSTCLCPPCATACETGATQGELSPGKARSPL